MSSLSETPLDERAVKLRDALGSRVVFAGDLAYDTPRMPWNVSVDQRPFAVATPESAEEVVDIVRAATAAGCGSRPSPRGTPPPVWPSPASTMSCSCASRPCAE